MISLLSLKNMVGINFRRQRITKLVFEPPRAVESTAKSIKITKPRFYCFFRKRELHEHSLTPCVIEHKMCIRILQLTNEVAHVHHKWVPNYPKSVFYKKIRRTKSFLSHKTRPVNIFYYV